MNKSCIYRVFSKLFFGVGCMLIVSCSEMFRDLNADETQLTPDLMNGDNYKLGAFFPQMQESVNPVQENDYQMCNSLIGDVYGRYMSITNDGWKNNFATFNAPNYWISYPFSTTFTKIYGPWILIKKETKGQGAYFAWAQILRVAAFHRITDMYGPIPYSKAGRGAVSVEYDSQEDVYKAMFADLTDAINTLTEYVNKNRGTNPLAAYDEVYGGDFVKWIKFANSLKLRMAMRIVYADEVLAKRMAIEAIIHPIGVIKKNSDNAFIAFPRNPINVMWDAYTDTRVCADIVSYMEGYKDPRMEKYFQLSEINGNKGYFGLRCGISISSKAWALKYSAPVANPTDKLLWMNASEVAFLLAEGALRGWNVGETAEQLYKEGIKLSFEQYGLISAEAYLANDTFRPADYVDPQGLYSEPSQSSITIKWVSEAPFEENLERIITQKWIAIWPLGLEAWSEQRRTGYPRFMPVKLNSSGEPTLTTKLASRIPFPPDEVENNRINYTTAVLLLNGSDNYSTRLWWDKKVK